MAARQRARHGPRRGFPTSRRQGDDRHERLSRRQVRADRRAGAVRGDEQGVGRVGVFVTKWKKKGSFTHKKIKKNSLFSLSLLFLSLSLSLSLSLLSLALFSLRRGAGSCGAASAAGPEGQQNQQKNRPRRPGLWQSSAPPQPPAASPSLSLLRALSAFPGGPPPRVGAEGASRGRPAPGP